MKTQAARELHTKTIDELSRDLRELKAEIAKLENEWIHGKLKNTNAVRSVKKDIARVMTIMHTKKLVPVAVEPVGKVEEKEKTKSKKVQKEDK